MGYFVLYLFLQSAMLDPMDIEPSEFNEEPAAHVTLPDAERRRGRGARSNRVGRFEVGGPSHKVILGQRPTRTCRAILNARDFRWVGCAEIMLERRVEELRQCAARSEVQL